MRKRFVEIVSFFLPVPIVFSVMIVVTFTMHGRLNWFAVVLAVGLILLKLVIDFALSINRRISDLEAKVKRIDHAETNHR